MRFTILSVAVLLTLAACTSPSDAIGLEAEALSGSVGILHVERFAGTEGRSDQTILRAAFARYTGTEAESVVSLLGSASNAALGSCAWVGQDEELLDLSGGVELLDVGALEVTLDQQRARLSPRTFPDLASVFVGVFYAGDARLVPTEGVPGEYTFAAPGGQELGGFEVAMPAPADLTDLYLAGANGGATFLDGAAEIIAPSDHALGVTWESVDPEDRVEVEISTQAATLECVSADLGHLEISAELLAALGSDPAARLRVSRVRVLPFDVPGLDSAYARLESYRTFTIDLR